MGKIAVLGVFVADATYRGDRMPVMGETVLGNSFALGPGGKGSNQAVAAARLGGDVSMITKLGADAFGDMALGLWKEAGITPCVQQDADSYTGSAFIYVDEASGDNAIIISPGAAATISPSDIDGRADVIEAADVFVTQLEQPLDAATRALEIARAQGVTTILNPAPAAELPDAMLNLCDFVTPNETETEALTGVRVKDAPSAAKACEALVARGVKTPIITMGEQGAYLYGHGMVPAQAAAKVVETTGAGDAFNGAVAYGLSMGKSPLEAVQIGCIVAGISVTRTGAAASMPAREEVTAKIAL